MTSQHDRPKRWRSEKVVLIAILVAFGTYLSMPVGQSIGAVGYLIGPALAIVVGLFVATHIRC